MTEVRVKMIVLASASLLAVQGVAHAQSNPWRIEPGTVGSNTPAGMQAFEQGYQRGFEQGLRAGQGIGAAGTSGPAAAAAASAGALPSTGASGWVAGSARALGYGAGYPGEPATGPDAMSPRDATRFGDFPPLEEADGRRSKSPSASQRRAVPPGERYGESDERLRMPHATPYTPYYPYPGVAPGYGYGGYGMPPGYAAGPSTFANPYGGLGGPALVPGGFGYPGGW